MEEVNPLTVRDFDQLMAHAGEIVDTIINALRNKYGDEYYKPNMLFILALLLASEASVPETIDRVCEMAKILWAVKVMP
jgi:hypothetical protein